MPALIEKLQISGKGGQGSVLSHLGDVYKKWGQYNRAVEYYSQAFYLQTLSTVSDRQERNIGIHGQALANLGSLYEAWGQYDRASQFFRQHLSIQRRLGNTRGEAGTLITLGRLLDQQGNHLQALKNYQTGMAAYARTGISTKWPKGLIGTVYLETGDTASAEPFLKEAGDKGLLGRLSLARSDYSDAKIFYDQLLKEAANNKTTDSLFTAYTGLGLSCEGMKNDQVAAEYFRKAVQLVEDLRTRVTPENRERFLDVRVSGFYRTTPYEGLSRVLIRLNKSREAWKNSEYTKARAFAESMSSRAGKGSFDLPKNTLQQDEDLNNELAALKRDKQTAYEKDDKEALASLDPKVKALEDLFQKHVKMMRDKYPAFAACKYPEPIDLSQTALKSYEWVLSYDVTDLGLIVYLTQGKELRKALLKPVTRKELDKLVNEFREPLDIKHGDEIEDKIARFDFVSGKKLADILLGDVLTELPKDAPLIIVPSDCLGVLPFETLVLNEGGKLEVHGSLPQISGAEFFGDRNPISYYQSVTALTLARNFANQKESGNKFLVMCDPVFSPDDPRAQKIAAGNKQELLNRLTDDVLMSAKTQNKVLWPRMQLTAQLGKDLKAVYPGVTDVFEGLQATKATFKRQDLTKYQAIVFGTHGYAGTDLGGLKEPVLVLTLINQPEGQDGFLRQSEVMGLKMNADVVALTACQSGLGKRISGEGTMGMGRAFQYAGAKSVLMSLWSVAQKSSVQLTDSFFRYLKEGKSKLEALKLAREEIRKAGYDHPFFWAPFILVGEVN